MTRVGQPILSHEDSSKTEIKGCCRLSTLLDVSLTEAAVNIVPKSIQPTKGPADLMDGPQADVPQLFVQH